MQPFRGYIGFPTPLVANLPSSAQSPWAIAIWQNQLAKRQSSANNKKIWLFSKYRDNNFHQTCIQDYMVYIAQ
jgi:hypothetical protein